MKHTVTPEQAQYTASLARLRLTGDEAQRMCRDLAALLTLADGLAQVDIGEKQADSRAAALLREDVPHACLTREALLENAPEHFDGMIAVPGAMRGDA